MGVLHVWKTPNDCSMIVLCQKLDLLTATLDLRPLPLPRQNGIARSGGRASERASGRARCSPNLHSKSPAEKSSHVHVEQMGLQWVESLGTWAPKVKKMNISGHIRLENGLRAMFAWDDMSQLIVVHDG